MLVEGKTALVSGVGTGLGREVAAALLREGANVVIGARTEATIDEVAAGLDPSGERVLAHPLDICDPESCAAFVGAAKERFGSIDALVQVAAYERSFGGLRDTDLGRWSRSFDTNVVGTMQILRAAVPVMTETGGGSVVLIGSQSMFKPALPQAGYAASKGALLTATYYLADELGPDGVRVNMVVPSWMWGPQVEMYVDHRMSSENRTRQEVLDEISGSFPLRRMAEDGEVADAVLFFCSDLSRAVTGQNLMVNCGEMMR